LVLASVLVAAAAAVHASPLLLPPHHFLELMEYMMAEGQYETMHQEEEAGLS
jgi:hypothetical protein